MIVDNKKVKWRHGLDKDTDVRYTQCRIESEDGVLLREGIAHCSNNDNYERETGRRLSLRRAIKDFPKTQRRSFWESYRTLGKRRW